MKKIKKENWVIAVLGVEKDVTELSYVKYYQNKFGIWEWKLVDNCNKATRFKKLSAKWRRDFLTKYYSKYNNLLFLNIKLK